MCAASVRGSGRRRCPSPPFFSRAHLAFLQAAGLPFDGDVSAITRKLQERNIYFVAGREAPGQQASIYVKYW